MKRLTKKIAYITSGVLALTAAIALIIPNFVNLSPETDHSPYKDAFKVLPDDGFREVTEDLVKISNDRIVLEMDTATTHFTVTDLLTGESYSSVPDEGFAVTSDEDKVRSRSELTILYYDDQSKSKYMGSGPHSVNAKNYKVLQKDDSIRVLYTFGTPADAYFVPAAFEKDFFENKVLAGLTDATDLRRVKRYYRLFDPAVRNDAFNEMLPLFPSISDRPLYVFVESTDSKDIMKDVTGYMEIIGYTEEDYANDSKNFDLTEGSAGSPTGFLVPVEYSLNENGFTAMVLTDRIEEYKETDKIVTVSLLEYFDASDGTEPMTYFVPDGSGALIKTTTANGLIYSQPIYGEDEAIYRKQRTSVSQTARLPVFGSYGNGKGYMTVIKGGASQAVLKAKTKGSAVPLNTISCDFNIRGMMSSDIGTDRNIPVINLYSKHIQYDHPILMYSFLEPDEQDYNGIASLYRQTLIDSGMLKDKLVSTGENMPVYLDFTCMITQKTQFLGISYDRKIVLSDFEGIADVVRMLHAKGIYELRIRLKGVSDEGLANSAAGKFKVSSRLGGVEELAVLSDLVTSKGGSIYFESSFSRVYRDKVFDSFRPKSDAVYNLDRTLARLGQFDIVTNEFNTGILPGYLVSPALFSKLAVSFASQTAEVLGSDPLVNISWEDAGSRLFSDFNHKKDFDRSMTIHETKQAIEEVVKVFPLFMTSGGNEYVLGHATDILSVPFNASFQQIEIASVPFYQLVINGKVSYAGPPFNSSSDYNKALLKAVEHGGNLYYDWIVNDDQLIKSTDHENVGYSLHYGKSINELTGQYTMLNKVWQSVRNSEIIRHEYLTDEVAMITYSNGVKIVINKSDEDYQGNGFTASKQDFIVIGGTDDAT
ncbi:MAG: DUF5696 domain-containing protein [Eubacteriales bacterium]|nr:DUF5696 domain-containing protein [Eubacteriales bacterium]